MNESCGLLLILSMMNINDYEPVNILKDLKYVFDSEVNNCLINLYFYMLKESDVLFKEFSSSYDLLDDGQKNYIKNEFLNIIKAQEKNELKRERKREDKNE